MQLLAGIGPLGLPELAIIAFIVVLVFGVGRLPEVGGAVGKGIREFRKAAKEDEAASGGSSHSTEQPVMATELEATSAGPAGGAMQSSARPATAPVSTAAGAPPAAAVFCIECGGRNIRGAKFCAHCGHEIAASIS